MIELKYSTEAQDVDTATSIDFQHLHHKLLKLIRIHYVEASTDFNPKPDDSCLQGIKIEKEKLI